MDLNLLNLRRDLHKHPELSGSEVRTAERIKKELQACNPSFILSGLGGNGVLACFESGKQGPGILFRCELDALPIRESNLFEHRSVIEGISHKCGHDGHMAILIGLAQKLKTWQHKTGRIYLLFQPAEETGHGAKAVVDDSRYQNLQIDYAFSLHNVPGYPLGKIVISHDWFSATVQSCAIYFNGVSAHAATPEKGKNPGLAIAALVEALESFNIPDPCDKDFGIATLIHMTAGSKDYGISAHSGELHLTLRSWNPERMNHMKRAIEEQVSAVSAIHSLDFRIEWFDYFPPVRNDADCTRLLISELDESGMDFQILDHPMKFGEDFGWFTKEVKGMMFGLGAGENCPPLHHEAYDFPDEIIDTGIQVLSSILLCYLRSSSRTS